MITIIKFANLLTNVLLKYDKLEKYCCRKNLLKSFFNASFASANTQIYVARSAAYEDDYPYCL
mgnify:CR=1 FL=1